MVGTFVVKVYLLFIFNFLGAFPLNKKSYLNKEKKKKIQFKKISLPWVTSMPLLNNVSQIQFSFKIQTSLLAS